MTVTLFEGSESLEVTGESYRQTELRQIVTGIGREVSAVLAPEPDNPHDPNAVSVWAVGLKVGYLSREDAEVYQPAIVRLMEENATPVALIGRIFGGQPDKPSFGIWLRHDPEDFGVRNDRTEKQVRAHQDHGGVLTGESAAKLAWLDQVPSDRLAAIKRLRELLASEADPVERHFMYLQLEERLYKSRDVSTSALDEFEWTCKAHDSEMDDIVPRLREALGGVPALPTYKQAAIMKQKQHKYQAALEWVERGLVLYGDDFLRADHVEDLRSRLGRYRKKLS